MIPKIFYQTFETADLVPGMQEARETWLTRNPDWESVFHDAVARRTFLAAEFGPDVVAAYDRLESGAHKADLWRYCILYKRGGVYADIDSICLLPLDRLLRPDDRFVASRSGGVAWAISNGFIASEAGSPFLRKAIDRGVREIHAGEPDGYVSIGPGALGIAVNIVRGKPQKTPFELGDNDGFRLFRKERSSIFEGDDKIIETEYEGYKDDLEEIGIAHWKKTAASATFLQRVRRRLRTWRDRE